MNPCLSVVIPVYNVEKYLPQCLDSILVAEGNDRAEIILIDDGSTDDSGKIADEYSANNKNIRVIHKSNEGASAARNLGINIATGRYILFCDADDMIEPHLFAHFINELENSEIDIYLWSADIIDESGKLIKSKYRDYFCYSISGDKEKVYSGYEFVKNQLLLKGDYPSVIWLGLYKRSFLIENELLFETGINHEDDLWVPQVILKAKCLKYTSERLYLYRIRSESLSKPGLSERSAYIESLLYIYPYLYNYCEDKYRDDSILPLLETCLTRKYLHWIYHYGFVKMGYGNRIDKGLLLRTSVRLRDKIRTLFLYCRIG